MEAHEVSGSQPGRVSGRSPLARAPRAPAAPSCSSRAPRPAPAPRAPSARPKPRPDIWRGLRSSRARSARRPRPPQGPPPPVQLPAPPAGRQARADSRPSGPPQPRQPCQSPAESGAPGGASSPRATGPRLTCPGQGSGPRTLPSAPPAPRAPNGPEPLQKPGTRVPLFFASPASTRLFSLLNPVTFYTSPPNRVPLFLGGRPGPTPPRCAPSLLPRVPWNPSVWVWLARSLSLVRVASLSHNLCFKFPRGSFPSGQALPSACRCASPLSRAFLPPRAPLLPGSGGARSPSGAQPAPARAPLLPAPA